MITLRAHARGHTIADSATVYRVLTDGFSWPTWIDLDSITIEQEGRDGGESVGAIRVFRFRRFGIRLTTREQIVELIPDRQYSYTLVSGLPLANYRADVELTPGINRGTSIRWSGCWQTKIPGTGRLTELALAATYRQFVSGLVHRADELAD